jgi:hypothetical protein
VQEVKEELDQKHQDLVLLELMEDLRVLETKLKLTEDLEELEELILLRQEGLVEFMMETLAVLVAIWLQDNHHLQTLGEEPVGLVEADLII